MIDTRPDIPYGITKCKYGILTYKNSDGFWYERTYNDKGQELSYRNSNGAWKEYFYDLKICMTNTGVHRL